MKQQNPRIVFSLLIASLILVVAGCQRTASSNAATTDSSNSKPSQRKSSTDLIDFEQRFVVARELALRGDYDQSYDVLWQISEQGDTELIRMRADIELCRTLEHLNRKDEAFYKRNATMVRLRELMDTKTPELGHTLLLAEAYAGKKDLDAADKIIENARLQFTDPDSRREIDQVASKLLLRRAEEIDDIEDEKNFRDKLDFVSSSLFFNEHNKDAQFQLIRYFVFAKLNSDQFRWMEDATIEGAQPAIVRVAMGVRDSLRDNNKSANKNFRIARETFPQTGSLANELTDYMVKSNSLPNDKLLNLVNVAIETCPRAMHLFRTRATLQWELGNYQAAVPDFQKFIDGVPDEFCVWSRKLLIDSLKKLGDTVAAETQEKEMSRIMASFTPLENARVKKILSDVEKKINQSSQ